MKAKLPDVGQWYHYHGDGQPFQVVAVDAGRESVELQYIDGSPDAMPFEHWHALALEPLEPAADDARASTACNDPGDSAARIGVDVRYERFDAADAVVDGDAALLAAELLPASPPDAAPRCAA